jgi:mRNA interferase RelE/StbE
MAYRIEFAPAAARDFAALPRSVQARLRPRIDALVVDPRPPGVEHLAGGDDLYRIRVGDDRVVYSIADDVLLVLVVRIGHRRDIYRRLRR